MRKSAIFLSVILFMSFQNNTIKNDWSNPIFIGNTGSNILVLLKTFSNCQNYEQMCNFTYKTQTYNQKSALKYWRKFDFGFKIIKLKSCLKTKQKYTLLYTISQNATEHQLIINCAIQNDTAKIIIPIFHN